MQIRGTGGAAQDGGPWEMGFIRGHLWRPATTEDISALGLPGLRRRYVARGGEQGNVGGKISGELGCAGLKHQLKC